MRRLLVALCLLTAPMWSAPAFAQARSQLGPLCTTDATPPDQMIDACSKIIALKVFKGEQLATVYFWRAVGWNKKGDYSKVIADATEAIRLQPSQAVYNLRGSAYYDKGDYDIAIADFAKPPRKSTQPTATASPDSMLPSRPRPSSVRPVPLIPALPRRRSTIADRRSGTLPGGTPAGQPPAAPEHERQRARDTQRCRRHGGRGRVQPGLVEGVRDRQGAPSG